MSIHSEMTQVFVRIRPGVDGNSGGQVEGIDDTTLKTVNGSKEKTFTFDRVFHQTDGQEVVYDSISQRVVESVLGYNTAIFSYGAVSSGKTFTMVGDTNHHGIIPKAIHGLYEEIERTKKLNPYCLFYVEMFFVEIYNNKIRNLLKNSADADERIDIHESQNMGVFLSGGANLLHSVKTEAEAVDFFHHVSFLFVCCC